MVRLKGFLHRRLSDRGATLVEYAMGIALVLVVSLVAINFAESASGDKLDAEAPDIGTPSEENYLPVGGSTTTPTTAPTSTLPPPGPVTAHVGGLTASQARSGADWAVTIEVVVVNAAGNPQRGVTCNGAFTPTRGATTATDVSDGQGICTLTQGDMPRNGPGSVSEVTFTVTSLSGPDVTYDSASDSPNPPTITVPQNTSSGR